MTKRSVDDLTSAAAPGEGIPCPSFSNIMIYDPPAGWRYGFPRQYKPLPGEKLADTLRRDGYPEKEDPDFAANHCRFWEQPK